MNRQSRELILFGSVLALLVGAAGCHRHKHAPPDPTVSQEPDKVLYEKAVEDIHNKRFDVARLTLQTLINAYPDSDYLAAAKLAVADSYYEEGTTGALAHAEVEYKDYITFFPNTPEVPYAQYRAAMTHFLQLEKPDRDRTQARRAQDEFRLLLINYPDSEYAADGERKLIQVQEVLAEGEFRIGRFYYIRGSQRAAVSRLAELVERYPNYSGRDEALWMLGQTYQKSNPPFWPGNPEAAADYYARIIREHPLSSYVHDAKAELTALDQPIPEPDPVLLARAQNLQLLADQNPEEGRGLLGRLFGIFSGTPDMSAAAARLGPPPLEPPKEEAKIPPPVLKPGRTGSSVSVQTVEDLPAGTIVQPGQANSKDESGAGTDNPNHKDGGKNGKKSSNPDGPKESAARKKSFWRKLIPFW